MKKFAGWNTMPDGSGKMYSDGEAFYLDGKYKTFGNVVVLYAMWE